MSTPTLVRTEAPETPETPETTAEPAVEALRRRVRGDVHLPGDEAYEQQRDTYRGAPAIVVEATSPADVRAAVLVAREHRLPFTVQSTGHGTLVPPDGGVLLKTSQMAQVLVDPDRRIARVGPGVRWSEVIAAAAPFGLAPLSGDTPSVGVAGYTLGGGLSWLSRKYGFAADSVLKVELVTADGRLVTADARRNADLFWALRGGSGNFGVVTALEFRLYPAATVYGGTAQFPIERAEAILRYFARNADDLPHELSLSFVVSATTVTVRGVFAGDEQSARVALRPLWMVAGTPLADGFRTMTYADTRTIGGTPPRQFEMFDELSDALIGKSSPRSRTRRSRRWRSSTGAARSPIRRMPTLDRSATATPAS